MGVAKLLVSQSFIWLLWQGTACSEIRNGKYSRRWAYPPPDVTHHQSQGAMTFCTVRFCERDSRRVFAWSFRVSPPVDQIRLGCGWKMWWCFKFSLVSGEKWIETAVMTWKQIRRALFHCLWDLEKRLSGKWIQGDTWFTFFTLWVQCLQLSADEGATGW